MCIRDRFKQLLMVAGLERYFQIARCYREVQYIGDQAEFYEEILVRSRATLRRFDGLIEAAMKQWRDISRTIEVYERPTRDEAGATVAMAILDEVDAVTDDLKESIEAGRNRAGAACQTDTITACRERSDRPCPDSRAFFAIRYTAARYRGGHTRHWSAQPCHRNSRGQKQE